MTLHKIRVLFILPSLCRAGAETQVVNLANLLPSDRYDKFVVTYTPNIDQYARIDHEHVSFHHFPRQKKFDIQVVRKAALLIDTNKIDIIHCTLEHATLFGWLTSRISKRKPKLVSAIHTTVNESFRGELSNRILYRWILQVCDHILFVSKKQRQYWILKYPQIARHSTVIYNGVDTTFFDNSLFPNQRELIRRSLDIPLDAFVSCCIANFRPEKSHDLLVKAFAKLPSNTFLLLVGDGATRTSVQHLVATLAIGPRVKFLGETDDVRPALAASDVSVLSSTAVETFSIAMLESMSMGVPMIAPDIGGLSEAITHGKTGFLYSVGDQNALVEAFTRIIHNLDRICEMRTHCRELIVDNFSQQAMISNIDRLLTEIVP